MPLLPETVTGHLDPKATNDTYGAFCRFIEQSTSLTGTTNHQMTSTAPTYPLLHEELRSIRRDKKHHARAARSFRNSGLLDNLHIHRLVSTEIPDTQHPAVGKKVVYDNPNLRDFPESHYHHVDYKCCHVVGPSSGDITPQSHLIVMDNLAPSDAVLRQMWLESHKKGDDFSMEQWFVGVAFYNWFHADKRLDQLLQRSARKIKSNVDARKNIVRSYVRQGDGLMTGVLERPD
jgi:hypothetical protein